MYEWTPLFLVYEFLFGSGVFVPVWMFGREGFGWLFLHLPCLGSFPCHIYPPLQIVGVSNSLHVNFLVLLFICSWRKRESHVYEALNCNLLHGMECRVYVIPAFSMFNIL
jgi:hypothetical protein